MSLENYKGVIPAFITPFEKDGNYSENCAKQMMEWQIRKGIGGDTIFSEVTGTNPQLKSMNVLVYFSVNTSCKRDIYVCNNTEWKDKNSNVRKWHTEVSRLIYKLNNSKIKGVRNLINAYINLIKGEKV